MSLVCYYFMTAGVRVGVWQVCGKWLGFILIFEGKKSSAKEEKKKEKKTLTDYFNMVFLNTGCHFS